MFSIASWHQRIFTFLLLEEGKAGPREVERGGQGPGSMKSALCGSALPGVIRAREKPKKNFYHGAFSAEVIAALPLSSLLLPPLLGGPGSGFPRKRKPAVSRVLPPCCAVGACFGDSHSWDTAPPAQCLVKAGPPKLPHAAPLCTGLTKSPFSTKGFREN